MAFDPTKYKKISAEEFQSSQSGREQTFDPLKFERLDPQQVSEYAGLNDAVDRTKYNPWDPNQNELLGFGKEFIKRAGQFGQGLGISATQSIQKIVGSLTAPFFGRENKKLQESIQQNQAVTDKILDLLPTIADPAKKEQLAELARDNIEKIEAVREAAKGNTEKLQEYVSGKPQEELKGEGAGALAFDIYAFMTPTKYINAANSLIQTGTKGLPKLLGAGTRIGARAAEEGLAARGVSALMGDPEEIQQRNAKWASIISGGFATVSELAGLFGGALIKKAQRIYQSALKPSIAGKGGPERATANVQTGLKEGIVLSEHGVQKTANVIDDLEVRLGQVIDDAAGAKGMVPTAPLKSFVDEAKEFIGNVADVKYAQRAVQDIDDIYTNFVKQYGDEIPVDVAQKIKTSTYRWLKDAYGELATPVKEANKQLVRGLKEGIVEAAPQVENINQRLGALYKFDEALQHARGRLGNLNLMGLGTKAIGAAGVAGKNPGLVALGFVNELLGSPFAKSGFAIKLYKLGNLIQKLSPEAATEFAANPALRDLLRRFTGKAGELTSEEQILVNKIKDFVENPRIGLSIEDISKKAAGAAATPETALTTKFMEYAKGKTTLSRQEIMDFARRPELKKGEADLLNNLAKDLPEGKLPAQEFADSIRRAEVNIKSGLREGQPPVGSDWNDITKTRIDLNETVARERFDIPNLKKISFGGSDRDVYELPTGEVLKVAKTSRGLSQNAFSADYYAENAGLIPKTIEQGKNYLVKEFIGKPDANTKKMVAEIREIGSFYPSAFSHADAMPNRQKAYDIMNKYGYSGDDLANYDVLWGDIQAIRNWGTRNGKPILLDEGTLFGDLNKSSEKIGGKNLTDPEFRDIYYQSRSAKKRFGDVDKKTMYGIGGIIGGRTLLKDDEK